MTLGHGPKVNTNGLVFAYDMESIKSYKGPQTTNSATAINPVYNTETSLFTMKPVYQDVYVPQIGWIRNCLAMDMYNDYNGGSGNCCPSPIVYYTGGDTQVNIQPSTLYTYAIVYKSTNGYTHPNFMYRYEYGSSGYLTEGGVFNNSNRIHLGDDWYWAWGTFTTQSATIRMTPRCFQYQYATWNRLYVAKVLLAVGNYTGLHPRFWPDLSEQVTSTNSVLDWTGNNTITANSLTYNSDGTFEFNGTTNYATVGNLGSFGEITVEVWVNYDAFDYYRNPVDCNYTTGGSGTGNIGPRMELNSSGNVSWVWSANTTTNNTYSNLISAYGISTGNWYHSVFSWKNSSTYAAYINGVNNGYTASHNGSNNGAWTGAVSDLFIGKGFALGPANQRSMDGKIGSVKIYNRALTASEVKQNFNALRGRYGL